MFINTLQRLCHIIEHKVPLVLGLAGANHTHFLKAKGGLLRTFRTAPRFTIEALREPYLQLHVVLCTTFIPRPTSEDLQHISHSSPNTNLKDTQHQQPLRVTTITLTSTTLISKDIIHSNHSGQSQQLAIPVLKDIPPPATTQRVTTIALCMCYPVPRLTLPAESCYIPVLATYDLPVPNLEDQATLLWQVSDSPLQLFQSPHSKTN